MQAIKPAQAYKDYGIQFFSTHGSFKTQEEKEEFVGPLVHVTDSAFHGVDFHETYCHIFGADDQTPERLVVAAYHGDRAVGFATFQNMLLKSTLIAYLVGVAIHESHHSRGLARIFLEKGMEMDQTWIIFQTQSPRMYEIARTHPRISNVHPNIEGGETAPNLEPPSLFALDLIHESYSLINGARVTTDGGIVRNAYSHPMYQKPPSCRSQVIKNWFTTNLGPHDGLIVAAEIAPPTTTMVG